MRKDSRGTDERSVAQRAMHKNQLQWYCTTIYCVCQDVNTIYSVSPMGISKILDLYSLYKQMDSPAISPPRRNFMELWYGLLISAAAGLAAGISASAKLGRARLPAAVGAAGCYLLLTLVLRGVVFGTLGQMPWATAAAVMAGAFAAAIMQSGKKKRRSGRR